MKFIWVPEHYFDIEKRSKSIEVLTVAGFLLFTKIELLIDSIRRYNDRLACQ